MLTVKAWIVVYHRAYANEDRVMDSAKAGRNTIQPDQHFCANTAATIFPVLSLLTSASWPYSHPH